MSAVRVNISLPTEPLVEVDDAADAVYAKRSEYIRDAIALKLQLDRYVAEQLTEKDSDMNIIRAVRMRNQSRKYFRKLQ
jgi:metal-responsive CopG/Arc/MetJ family transcriptional regulator